MSEIEVARTEPAAKKQGKLWAIVLAGGRGTRLRGLAKHEPALNELAVLGWRRRSVGVCTFVLLFLIMAPVPHRFMDALGIMSPYIPVAGGPML